MKHFFVVILLITPVYLVAINNNNRIDARSKTSFRNKLAKIITYSFKDYYIFNCIIFLAGLQVRNAAYKYQHQTMLDRSGEKVFMEIIGVVSGMMGIYDFLTKTPGISDDQIKQGFNDVQQQLNTIQNMIDQTISLIVDTSIRNQYVTTERVITESLRCYNAYTSMTAPDDVAYWQSEFL